MAGKLMTTGEATFLVDYAEIWQGAEKVVCPTTLDEVTTACTGLVREFDAAEVGRMKQAADRDLSVGGPHLAAHALRAGLVDELHVSSTRSSWAAAPRTCLMASTSTRPAR